jgi:formyltetrahydrofolate deformylase
MEHYILTLKCQDRLGVVSEITTALAKNKGFITELSQYGDPLTGRFFMRLIFTLDDLMHLKEIEKTLKPVIEKFQMDLEIQEQKRKINTLVLVSKYGHCLNELLYQTTTNHLPIEIKGIGSNHLDLEKMASWYHLPYFTVSHTASKLEQENQIRQFIQKNAIDLIILARYMQILSPEFTRDFSGKIINIHHSFLPSFKGAKPYHQAYERGVKIIGATAHYVTEDLDEGPIICQGVKPITHHELPDELVKIGQDVENDVLIKAVKLHADKKVFLNGHKTVVF